MKAIFQIFLHRIDREIKEGKLSISKKSVKLYVPTFIANCLRF